MIATHILILPIARNPISIIKTLNNLRPEDVIPIRDPETRALIERRLVRRDVRRVPTERLGADAREGLGVGVLAGVDELEAEVGVLLLFEDQAAEEEHAAVEAGEMLRVVVGHGAVVCGAEGEVGAGGGVRGEVLDGGVGGEGPAM